MLERQISYKQIVKSTSIYGGVEIFKIVIKVIQSKVMAVLLGPAGVGVFALLQSTGHLIEGLTGFGLKTSSVKNIASVSSTGDTERLAIVVQVLRKLVIITGLLGAIVTAILARWLSDWTFGNEEYTYVFIWISLSLFFNQICYGQLSLLQGLRRIKHLANANLTGSLIGLIISIPLYYFFGVDGITPAIISISFANMFRAWYFARKVKLERVKVNPIVLLIEGKEMLIMGFVLSLSGFIATGASYLLRVYIRHEGGIEDVGLYSAGFMIINTYVGLVFAAMVTDYYPRLSAVTSDNNKVRTTINQQAEITILFLSPILIIFMIHINWIIPLLYSDKFLAINSMIQWAALGMYFKAISWSVAIVFLAKSSSSLFFVNELLATIYLFLFNFWGYRYAGLEGLGISFIIAYFLYLVQVYFVAKHYYGFEFSKDLLRVFILQLFFGFIATIVVLVKSTFVTYIFGSTLVIVSLIFSYREISKRVDIWSLIKRHNK